MRILMLSQFYPPFIGGEAIHVQSLSTKLASRGHEVAVVTLWHDGLATFEEEQGVRVYRVRSSTQRLPWLFNNRGRRRAPPFPDPGVTLALRHIITREQPEIVHGHNWLVYSFLPLKRWSKTRLVVTLHNYNLVCANTSLLRHGALCEGPRLTRCLDCAAHFYGPLRGTPIVLGNHVTSTFERGLVDMFLPVSQATAAGNNLIESKQPFQIIPNFMPDESIPLQGNAEPYLSQLPAGEYLLFVGNLGYPKGVDVLLRAYAGLTKPPPLVLIGYQTSAWPHIAQELPDNVFVLNDWPHYAVMEAWRRCGIALAPSVVPETFGMAVMEAMASERPVIASRSGALPDLIADGETGLLVPPGDAPALQQAIERLLANADLRRAMGQAAARRVAEFQASTVIPRIEQVYQELLQQDEYLMKAKS